MTASINSIESFGTVDGPGVRTVVFFNKCPLRCIYCHNPEMWYENKDSMMTSDELVEKILKNKEYFAGGGGVTFSGGEPLLHVDYLIEVCQKLKKEGIHIALDTCGVGIGKYEELLPLIDLVILDIKHTNKEGYKKVTQVNTDEAQNFIAACNKLNKKFWIRQVIVPGIMDNEEYLISLKEYLKGINNIEQIEFLPYHKLGQEKYETLNIPYPCKDIPEMNPTDCDELYNKFIKMMAE